MNPTINRSLHVIIIRGNSTIVSISSKVNMSSLDDIVTIVEFHRRRYRCVNRSLECDMSQTYQYSVISETNHALAWKSADGCSVR